MGTTAGLLGICAVLLEDTDSDNDDNDELLMVAESESLRADIQYISEPVERKYLRFHSPGLQSSFMQLFRFRAEEMPRLLHCLRMPRGSNWTTEMKVLCEPVLSGAMERSQKTGKLNIVSRSYEA